jgi:hypothetical protein
MENVGKEGSVGGASWGNTRFSFPSDGRSTSEGIIAERERKRERERERENGKAHMREDCPPYKYRHSLTTLFIDRSWTSSEKEKEEGNHSAPRQLFR